MPLQRVTEPTKGVVHPAAARKAFRMERYLPEPDLAPFVDFFWLLEWHLPNGVSHVQRTLPYPCVNLVFDQGRTAIFGVVTGAFDYTVQGSNRILGIRFRPGGFRGFLGRPLQSITDQVIGLAPLFGDDDAQTERVVLSTPDDAAMVAAASAMLRLALPPADPRIARVGAVLDIIRTTPALTQVQALSDRAGISVRSLQMLFQDVVGVSPKWAIRRNRLHDAADRLANGSEVDLAELAQALGYFDQAHFTSDFEKLVGQPPADYRRHCRAAQAGPVSVAALTSQRKDMQNSN